MDLEEENKFVAEFENFLNRKLKRRNFHAIIAVEEDGNGFAFSSTTLSDKSAIGSGKLIVDGIMEEANNIAEKLKIPSETKLKKPIELK